MVEDVRPSGKDGFERVPIAAKIRNQHFHLARRNAAANLCDRAGEEVRAAVGLVVAIDRGHDRVTQAHALDRLGHAQRLVLVGRADGLARGYGAEAAGARTDIAQDHEGGGAMLPAFAHVRATRTFAHGVQVERAHDALQVLIVFAAEEFYAEPFRTGIRDGRQDGQRRRIGQDVEGRVHAVIRNRDCTASQTCRSTRRAEDGSRRR